MLKLKEGEILPPFYYGFAYLEYFSYYSVYYPIPFNYVVRYSRYCKEIWNRFRSKTPRYDKRVHRAIQYWKSIAYWKGYNAGIERGMKITGKILKVKTK